MNVCVTSRCTWMNARQKNKKKESLPFSSLNLNPLHHVSHTLGAKFRFAQVQCMQLVGRTVEVIHYSLQSPLKSLLFLWRLHFCIIHFFAYLSFFRIFLGKEVGALQRAMKNINRVLLHDQKLSVGNLATIASFFRCCHATFSFSFAEWKDEYHFWYGICRIPQIVIKQKYPKFSV